MYMKLLVSIEGINIQSIIISIKREEVYKLLK